MKSGIQQEAEDEAPKHKRHIRTGHTSIKHCHWSRTQKQCSHFRLRSPRKDEGSEDELGLKRVRIQA